MLSQMAKSGEIENIGYGKYTVNGPDTPDSPDTYGGSEGPSVSGVSGVSNLFGVGRESTGGRVTANGWMCRLQAGW